MSKKRQDKSNRIVLAKTYSTLVEASIAEGVLRTNGIPCTIDNAIMPIIFGPAAPVPASDGIRLMVFERDLPVALRLLDHRHDGSE